MSRTARVTYLTSASAYIDAGREAGLREGALVKVVRGGAVIGVLKVTFLSSRQASCDIVSESTPVVVGDSVRFTAAAPPRDSTVAARPSLQTVPSRSALRGYAGAHYLRLDGRPVSGGPIGLSLDVRARRTVSTLGGGTAIDGHARAYQLAMSWNPPSSPGRITLGRQIAPPLAVVGVFDGVLAEVHAAQWSAGVFSGTQPDPVSLGFATDIVEGGGYVQRRSRPGGRQQWSTTLGLSGSYQNAHANREFAFLQASFSNGRFSSYVSQEIDYYRSWKRTPGMAAISCRLRQPPQCPLVSGLREPRHDVGRCISPGRVGRCRTPMEPALFPRIRCPAEQRWPGGPGEFVHTIDRSRSHHAARHGRAGA